MVLTLVNIYLFSRGALSKAKAKRKKSVCRPRFFFLSFFTRSNIPVPVDLVAVY